MHSSYRSERNFLSIFIAFLCIGNSQSSDMPEFYKTERLQSHQSFSRNATADQTICKSAADLLRAEAAVIAHHTTFKAVPSIILTSTHLCCGISAVHGHLGTSGSASRE